jgi:hypothetical protein
MRMLSVPCRNTLLNETLVFLQVIFFSGWRLCDQLMYCEVPDLTARHRVRM